MKAVLNKGPGFVPDQEKLDPVDIGAGTMRMRRDMRWKEYFSCTNQEENM